MGNQNKFCLFFVVVQNISKKLIIPALEYQIMVPFVYVKKAIFWLYIDLSKKSFVHV